MAKVAIVRCDGYDQAVVDEAVRKAVDLAAGAGWAGSLEPPVLVKPNVLAPQPPERGVCTHPAVLRAVLALLRDGGVRDVAVGDSSGGSGTRATATDRSLEVSGLAAAAREMGARVLSFDHEEAVSRPNPRGSAFRPLTLARPAVEAASLVSVSKLKTHALTVLTAAIKNLFGTVPGAAKREYHRLNPSVESFANALVDIVTALAPKLHIVDAVWAMEGPGPSAGPLRKVGLILAGTDPVAVDAVAAAVVGLDPRRVPTTRLAAERGLGVADLRHIEVVGTPLAEARVTGFRLPASSGLLRHVPPALTRAALSFVVTRPAFDATRCTRCGVCAKNCPLEALRVGPEVAVPELDDGKCIGCFCCHELCPNQAVSVRFRHPLTRLILGRRG